MSNKNYRDVTIKLDNSAGSLTEITAYCNQYSLDQAVGLIEETWFGQKKSSYQPGMLSGKVSLNGMVNSTTEPIFGKLIGVNTSITKSLQIGNGQKFYYGEVWPTDIKFSGSHNDLQVWSANFTFSSAITRTSVTQS